MALVQALFVLNQWAGRVAVWAAIVWLASGGALLLLLHWPRLLALVQRVSLK